MCMLIRKPDNFLLDRWTVPWALPLSPVSFKRWQLASVLLNHIVRFLVCSRHETVQKLVWRLEVLPFMNETKRLNDCIWWLYLSDWKINGLSFEAGWCSCCCPVYVKFKFFQCISQANWWRLCELTVSHMTSCRVFDFTHMNHPS
mgnify:FL=1